MKTAIRVLLLFYYSPSIGALPTRLHWWQRWDFPYVDKELPTAERVRRSFAKWLVTASIVSLAV